MIRPLRDVIFFTPLEKKNKIGGIFIPENTGNDANQTFVKAKIIAAGPKVELAKVGSIILVSEYKDTSKRVIDGVETWNCRERDILGVVT